MSNEADTCRKYVVPLLQNAGWDREPYSIAVFPDLGYSRHYRYLKNVLMPVPPLCEQLRIVAELDALQAEVDALKRLQAETAAELDALIPSILDRAFKGEL